MTGPWAGRQVLGPATLGTLSVAFDAAWLLCSAPCSSEFNLLFSFAASATAVCFPPSPSPTLIHFRYPLLLSSATTLSQSFLLQKNVHFCCTLICANLISCVILFLCSQRRRLPWNWDARLPPRPSSALPSPNLPLYLPWGKLCQQFRVQHWKLSLLLRKKAARSSERAMAKSISSLWTRAMGRGPWGAARADWAGQPLSLSLRVCHFNEFFFAGDKHVLHRLRPVSGTQHLPFRA